MYILLSEYDWSEGEGERRQSMTGVRRREREGGGTSEKEGEREGGGTSEREGGGTREEVEKGKVERERDRKEESDTWIC